MHDQKGTDGPKHIFDCGPKFITRKVLAGQNALPVMVLAGQKNELAGQAWLVGQGLPTPAVTINYRYRKRFSPNSCEHRYGTLN